MVVAAFAGRGADCSSESPARLGILSRTLGLKFSFLRRYVVRRTSNEVLTATIRAASTSHSASGCVLSPGVQYLDKPTPNLSYASLSPNSRPPSSAIQARRGHGAAHNESLENIKRKLYELSTSCFCQWFCYFRDSLAAFTFYELQDPPAIWRPWQF